MVLVNRCYSAYGLKISSNLELPLAPAKGSADLQVRFQSVASRGRKLGKFQVIEEPLEGRFRWRLTDNGSDILTALLDLANSSLTIRFCEGLGEKAMIEAFLHPLLARVLRVMGFPALHAAVVSFEGNGVVLLGDSGSGKSTLAQAFVQKGAELVSDDLAVLQSNNKGWMIPSGAAGVRLYRQGNQGRKIFSLQDFPQPPMALKTEASPISSGSPVRLALAVVLGNSSGEVRAVGVREAKAKLYWLMRHRFTARLLSEGQKRAEFELLARLARDISLIRLHRPRDLGLLDTQVTLIRELLSRPPEEM